MWSEPAGVKVIEQARAGGKSMRLAHTEPIDHWWNTGAIDGHVYSRCVFNTGLHVALAEACSDTASMCTFQMLIENVFVFTEINYSKNSQNM